MMKSSARPGLLPVFVLFGSLAVVLVVVVGATVTFQMAYSGRAMPGVHVQGADVSGMRPAEIFKIAQDKATYFRTPALTLQLPDQSLALRPVDFGAGLDPAATTQRVLEVGRSGDLLTRLREEIMTWWYGKDLAPVVLVDDHKAASVVAQMAAQVQRAPRNAAVTYDGAKGVQEISAEAGRVLDTNTSLAMIQAAISGGQRVDLKLPVTQVPPDITSAAAAAAEARRIFSQDLVVMAPKWDANGQPQPPQEAFRIKGSDLAMFVSVDQQVVNGAVKLSTAMRRDKLTPMIEQLAPAVNQEVTDARFTFNPADGTLTNILPSQAGRSLNVKATLDAIEAALNGDNRQVTVVVDTVQPAVSTAATAAQLGITQLITQATTYFKGSTAARMVNVKVAAARFNGVVVAPHETFSFDKYLGNVSTDDGFEEGLVIVGDRTIKGVGGGVCQVSTTAYQAAMRAGFPIVERYPHGYRVGYYERGMGPGFDATVYSPVVDLKFVNDSDTYMIIETFFDQANATLTFKFYGTPDGRQVSFDAPVISKIVPHGPSIYEKATDGSVAPGKVLQVDWAVDGATIVTGRTVTRNGVTLINEKIVSKYVPWQAVFRYGDGYTPPDGAVVR
ncbi:MAG: VanW family protein [Chloroflexi bacterium]|nr:VanW family protein [Chloroflexota bacterium]MCL5274410.1 VanW family protein [Chloroflexota bacterium]